MRARSNDGRGGGGHAVAHAAPGLSGWSSILSRLPRTSASSEPLVVQEQEPRSQGRLRPARAIRIGLFGLFGSGNSGNDGSLEAMLLLLKRACPDAQLTCFCSHSDGAAARITRDFRLAATPFALPRPVGRLSGMVDRLLMKAPRQLASLVRAFGHARRLDVLIVPGTGILDDFQEGPLGMPLALFGWCLAARLAGARIAFVSIGAGPIVHPLSRWLMRSAVGMACYRSYRDTISKQFMESIGFDTGSDRVFPDLAFGLPAPPLVGDPAADGNGALSVGLGVMWYRGWRGTGSSSDAILEAYVRSLTRFALWLLDRGHSVRILMGHWSDQHVADALVGAVRTARSDLQPDRLVVTPTPSLHALMAEIARTHVVVATRFHNVVCALKMGRPTISIGYADKNDALMKEMALGEFCQHVERLDVDLLIEQFLRLTRIREDYQRGPRAVTASYVRDLEDQERILINAIL